MTSFLKTAEVFFDVCARIMEFLSFGFLATNWDHLSHLPRCNQQDLKMQSKPWFNRSSEVMLDHFVKPKDIDPECGFFSDCCSCCLSGAFPGALSPCRLCQAKRWHGGLPWAPGLCLPSCSTARALWAWQGRDQVTVRLCQHPCDKDFCSFFAKIL